MCMCVWSKCVHVIIEAQPVVSFFVFMFTVLGAASDVKCLMLTTSGAPITHIITTTEKTKQITTTTTTTTTIILRCNSLLGNFGTSILVGVALTCTTQLNIIADPVCPLRGTWQRDFMSLAPWIIWISEPRGARVNFFHCLFYSTPHTCVVFFSCPCVRYFWIW